MKKLHAKILGAALALSTVVLLPSTLQAAAFTPGNLVVHRIGDASTLASTAASPAYLDEYTTSGTFVQTITLPTQVATSGNRALNGSSSGMDGQMTLSVDKRYICCVGYNAPIGTATVNGTLAGDYARVIGRIDASGNIESTTALSSAAYDKQAIRDAVITGSSVYSVGGGTPNIGYTVFGQNTAVSCYTVQGRSVEICDSKLYYLAGTALYRFDPPPTASASPTSVLPAGAAPSDGRYFFMLDVGNSGSVNTCYIIEGTTTLTLRKYSISSGVFTAQGTTALSGSSAAGITAKDLGNNNVQLYITFSVSPSVVKTFIDSGGTGQISVGSPTTVCTASSSNFRFQGITFAPVAYYSVTYDANGGTGSQADANSPYAAGASVAVKDQGTMTRAGYTFSGWKTAPSGGTAYQPSDTFIINANTTLYAQWTLNCSTATVSAGPNQTVPSNVAAVLLSGTVGGGATGGTWTGGAGTFDPNASSLNVSYTPTAAEKAARQLTLTLTTTGANQCAPASGSTIITFNSPPVAGGLNLITANNSPASFPLNKYASDADEDTLFFSSNGAAQGTVSFSSGTVTYTPNANASGTDSFTYRVTDPFGYSANATVSVTLVTPGGPANATTYGKATIEGVDKFRIVFAGILNAHYKVEKYANGQWGTLTGYGDVNAGTSGLFEVLDDYSETADVVLYRTVYLSAPQN